MFTIFKDVLLNIIGKCNTQQTNHRVINCLLAVTVGQTHFTNDFLQTQSQKSTKKHSEAALEFAQGRRMKAAAHMTHCVANINAFLSVFMRATFCGRVVRLSAERCQSDSYTNDLREAAVQRTNVSTASHTLSAL